ncbi:MAG TPA: glycosyltransferase [Fimbriimonas sp.]|nr:glycosyltransferase [Fimbriimonas sp.]
MDLENDFPGGHADETQSSDRTKLAKSGKSVLILDFDLFTTVGGGQSAYRRFIALSQENTYYYFISNEAQETPRPSNTRAIPFKEFYFANSGNLPAEMNHIYHCYMRAFQLAASVANSCTVKHFDVVDGPDYRFDTLFIRGALAAHGISTAVVALAMHGNISTVFRDDWSGRNPDTRALAELRAREHLQYRGADCRYSISQMFADRWRSATGLSARVIDPLCMVPEFRPIHAAGKKPRTDLLYVGRRERCKGPDLFVDMAWTLGPEALGRVLMIGPDALGHSGASSVGPLNQMAQNRKIPIEIINSLSQTELEQFYSTQTVLVLPARYETFNLVALEALRFGCPVFVGEGAGFSHWLRRSCPELSYLIIDVKCDRAASASVRGAISNYDEFRRRLVDDLATRDFIADTASLKDVYSPSPEIDKSARRTLTNIQVRFDSFSKPRPYSELPLPARTKLILRDHSSDEVRRLAELTWAAARSMRRKLGVVRHPKRYVRQKVIGLAASRLQLSSRSIQQLGLAREIEGTRERLLTMGERTLKDIDLKLSMASAEVSQVLLARVPIFADMARLEIKRRSGSLIAATYYLRLMRWLGEDRLGHLEYVAETLREHGFRVEADVAEAMFAPPAERDDRCKSMLVEQFRKQLTKPDLPLAVLDDRRKGQGVRVAVIVSLYNAESKLKTLLRNITLQSLSKAGLVEIVLVDSNSPTNEYEVFKDFAREHPEVPIAFARSAERETIQAAWNRGIKLSTAPYLCFLGADEGLHPDCLGILAQTLDGNPDVDWVTADSIVTNVDKGGTFNNDIMVYDRSGYHHSMVYLDTTYLNWVGGMYRKSIHDRFGYYDEAFRAAGDTEFKLRIMKHIKSMHLPQRLGVFNNYPEERTTQHPRAEIEDLRAWYLHRTPAGMSYCFDDKTLDDVMELFRRTLSYRKAYFRHVSTDIDLGHAIAGYLVRRNENPTAAKQALRTTDKLLGALRGLDTLDFKLSPGSRQRQLLSTLWAVRQQSKSDQATFRLSTPPAYEVFNDNRYEQHWWSWSS